MTNTPPTDALKRLESAIKTAQIDLFLLPMGDEFQSEYTHASAARLPYVTGFSGSAGMGAFWVDAARGHTLFVDGRYTLQAADQVDGSQITVLNSGDVKFSDWLAGKAADGLRVGFDPWLMSEQQLEGWKKATVNAAVEWVALASNPVDGIWADRPALPAGEINLHPLEYAGVAYPEKRDAILAEMKKQKADACVLAQPDGINWLLNIRGADIPFNPLLLSYLVLSQDGSAVLYVYSGAVNDAVKAYFAEQNITLRPVTEVFEGKLDAIKKSARVMMDKSVTAHGWFALAQANGWQVIAADDPTLKPKAIKNPTELEGIRAAHKRDGLALTRFLQWFDGQIAKNKFPDELEIVDRLEQFRAAHADYRGASFATIAGAGPHGAIVHYRADGTSNRKTALAELLLLDSGGQYPDGTTDVTRTMVVGKSSAAMRDHFTRVLKGHIALGAARFPEGTSGIQLDALARQYLWEVGLDYDHGTGHGVGAYLCVHEGPQRISKKGSMTELVPGMVISNEPGYYLAGEYGIRIESLVAVVEVGRAADGKKLFGFETLTLVPIDTRLINLPLLTAAERNWLNAYHQRVYQAHESAMDSDGRAWLMNATRAI